MATLQVTLDRHTFFDADYVALYQPLHELDDPYNYVATAERDKVQTVLLNYYLHSKYHRVTSLIVHVAEKPKKKRLKSAPVLGLTQDDFTFAFTFGGKNVPGFMVYFRDLSFKPKGEGKGRYYFVHVLEQVDSVNVTVSYTPPNGSPQQASLPKAQAIPGNP